MGVPTAINIISESLIALPMSVVKDNLFDLKFLTTSSSRPGSKIGIIPFFKLFIFFGHYQHILLCFQNQRKARQKQDLHNQCL